MSSKRKKKHGILKAILSIIAIIILFMAGFVGYSTYKNGWGVKSLIQTAMGTDDTELEDLDPFTVLILGVSKDITVELTDTIIIASYNPKTQKATLISIPRDTYIGTNKNAATSYDKINALYQTSPQKTLAAVNKLTGLEIPYYVVVSNSALIELVDAIGGVEYNVPMNMEYDDSSQDLYIRLKAGPQKLTGEQAEWLVRFRHNNDGTTYPAEYGNNDLGRMRTQREFITEVAKQTLQLKNITKIGTLVDILKQNVKTNITNWNLIKKYIPYAVDFNTENIQAKALPGTTDTYNNLWFFIHDKKETKELIEELFIEQDGAKETEKEIANNNTSSGKTTNNVSKNTATNSSNTNSAKGNTGTKPSNTNSSSKNTTTNSVKSNLASKNTTSSSTNTASNIKIELLNGSGDSALLTKATKALKAEGYNVYKTGTTTSTSKTTIVNKTAVKTNIVEDIKSILKVGNISTSVSSSSTVDIKIILGKDYK